MTNQHDNTKNKILIAMMILPLIAIGLTVPSVNAFDFPFVDDNDHDGVTDAFPDNCPFIGNPLQTDGDGDLIGDVCDSAPADSTQPDLDGDGTLDPFDPDVDGDTILNGVDNCPLIASADQTDDDGDGIGLPCDTDDTDSTLPDADADGILDPFDNCPVTTNGGQADLDGDGLGDACDPDDDNDGVLDNVDNCQFNANLGQEDSDGDGAGDACDDILNVDGDIKPGSFPNSVNCDNKGVEKRKSVTPIELFFGLGLVPSTVNLDDTLKISYEGGTTLIEKHGKIHLEDSTNDDMDNPNGVIHVITQDLCLELASLPNGEVEVTISGTQGNPVDWEFKDTVCLVKQVGGGEGAECEGADDGEEEADVKVTICHKNKKTISVSEDSAEEHKNEHGDSEGACTGNGGPPGQDKATQEVNKAETKLTKIDGKDWSEDKKCKEVLKLQVKLAKKGYTSGAVDNYLVDPINNCPAP